VKGDSKCSFLRSYFFFVFQRDLKQEITKAVIQKVEEDSGAPLGAARRAFVEWKTFKEVGELRGSY